MDIEHLREFVTVASFRSMSRAAEELHMSQPALSAHISSLEKRYGSTLFYRERPLRLTPAGEALVDGASAVINAFDAMEQRVSDAGRRNSIVLGYNDTHHAGVLNAFTLIGEFGRQNPDIAVQMVPISAPTIASALQSMELDGVISCASPIDSDLEEGVTHVVLPALVDDRLHLWVDEAHPLAAKSSLRWEDLNGIRLPHSEKSFLLWSSAALQMLHNHGLDVMNIFRSMDNIAFLQSLSPDEVQLFDATYLTYPVLNLFPNRRLIPIDEPDAHNTPLLGYDPTTVNGARDRLLAFIDKKTAEPK